MTTTTTAKAVCARCHRERELSARLLCRPCSATASKTGTLRTWPLVHERRSLRDFAEDFAILDERGMSYMDICRTLGYSTANGGAVLRVLIIRAQRARLLPKRTPVCGWGPSWRQLSRTVPTSADKETR